MGFRGDGLGVRLLRLELRVRGLKIANAMLPLRRVVGKRKVLAIGFGIQGIQGPN